MIYLNTSKIKVTERGWQGHFLCKCDYHRNTLLEYKDKKIVVSTVGNYKRNDEKVDTISLGVYYETRCFKADVREDYIEADTFSEIPIYAKITEISELTSNVENYADKMHENVIREMKIRLIEGHL